VSTAVCVSYLAHIGSRAGDIGFASVIIIILKKPKIKMYLTSRHQVYICQMHKSSYWSVSYNHQLRQSSVCRV